LNCTPKQHADYASLCSASDVIGSAVMTINNKKKETEANNYMLELHNSIDAKHVWREREREREREIVRVGLWN
jgi:hypothetical protein